MDSIRIRDRNRIRDRIRTRERNRKRDAKRIRDRRHEDSPPQRVFAGYEFCLVITSSATDCKRT